MTIGQKLRSSVFREKQVSVLPLSPRRRDRLPKITNPELPSGTQKVIQTRQKAKGERGEGEKKQQKVTDLPAYVPCKSS